MGILGLVPLKYRIKKKGDKKTHAKKSVNH